MGKIILFDKITQEEANALIPSFMMADDITFKNIHDPSWEISLLEPEMIGLMDIKFSDAVPWLCSIRQDSRLFLMPVFSFPDVTAEKTAAFTDGRLTDESRFLLLKKNIRKFREKSLLTSSIISRNEQLLYQMLLFLLTREIHNMPPRISEESLYGYTYAPVFLFWGDDKQMWENITHMKDKGVFSGSMVEKMNICPRCSSWTMVFRDVCPNCRSLAIGIREMLHHFQCAHIAPRDEFAVDDLIICPKCHKELRHIGVDYDKPSDIFLCDDCGYQFSDPEYNSRCMRCGTISRIEDMGQIPVWNISINPSAAADQLDNIYYTREPPLVVEGSGSSVTLEMLRKSYLVEIRRMKRYGKTLGVLRLELTSSHISPESRRFLKVRNVVDEILRTNLRDSDILFMVSPTLFIVFLTELSDEGVSMAKDRIEARIMEFLKGEKITDVNLDLSLTIIRPDTPDTKSSLERIIKNQGEV